MANLIRDFQSAPIAISIVVGIISLLIFIARFIFNRKTRSSAQSPVPGLLIIGKLLQWKEKKPHKTFTRWAETYGTIYSYVERNLEFLSVCMDECTRTTKLQFHYRRLSRQQAQQQAWLQKRRFSQRALWFLGLDEERSDSRFQDLKVGYCMPGKTGYELLRKIKIEGQRMQWIKIIFLVAAMVATKA